MRTRGSVFYSFSDNLNILRLELENYLFYSELNLIELNNQHHTLLYILEESRKVQSEGFIHTQTK